MAIAVTENGAKVYQGMLGRAVAFLIFDLDMAWCIVGREWRTNIYQHTLQHDKTLDVADLLKDCQVLISWRIGPRGIPRLRARNLELIFTNSEDAEAALQAYVTTKKAERANEC
ncbi:MAG: NifB/NifX family molybdenum-iron cluster-binding protein [Chloroflexota bacterium]|nr:NifB/NifX family molybdenum-iron cluster-binding protein [Chloroflexota bacterium]